MQRARPRARRSRYNISYRLTRSVPAMLAAVVMVALVGLGTLAYVRLDSFMKAITGRHFGLGDVVQAAKPQPGTIAYKLQNGQRVSILLLGMGGEQNGAPYLTDSIMAVTIDPTSHRVMLASIPRDMVVHMDLQANPRSIWTNKINAAYEVPYVNIIANVAPQYQGHDGGGLAAEHEVGKVTGITFDRFIAVDFKAFRDMVDALGGVTICLSTKLDDNQYPDYNNGFVRGGIHYQAGCKLYKGEDALRIARSRHADEPEQSSDFGRSRRQQDIMEAIKKKAITVNGFAKAPALLDALQKNITTDMTLSDMKAIYDWGKNLPDSSIIRLALVSGIIGPGNFLYGGDCGMGPGTSQLCPLDPTYAMIHQYFASVFVDPSVLAEKAPIQIANGAYNFYDLDSRVTAALDPFGFQLADPVPHRAINNTVILDYTGGKLPLTAKWLSDYFSAPVSSATPTSPAPAAGQQTFGLVVVVGHDYARRWLGLG